MDLNSCDLSAAAAIPPEMDGKWNTTITQAATSDGGLSMNSDSVIICSEVCSVLLTACVVGWSPNAVGIGRRDSGDRYHVGWACVLPLEFSPVPRTTGRSKLWGLVLGLAPSAAATEAVHGHWLRGMTRGSDRHQEQAPLFRMPCARRLSRKLGTAEFGREEDCDVVS